MIYRVHFYDDADGSDGFDYYSNSADAETALTEWLGDRERRPDCHYIVTIKTPKTQHDVIRLLKMWATHADNG